jgi:hypothetical protein
MELGLGYGYSAYWFTLALGQPGEVICTDGDPEKECVGRRLCEPCAHLERLTHKGILRKLIHRGGLRADILTAGSITVGAAIESLEPDEANPQR